MKVAIIPTWTKQDHADGGIRRVSEAQWKWLPSFGIEPLAGPDGAELIACHGTTLETRPGVPMVSHNHGLYWASLDWSDWAHEANRQVVRNMAAAVAHTAPSHWVANAIRRGMLVYPEVIHHGVDTDIWTPADDWQSYVLWNKARADPVSAPEDMENLARIMPNVEFKSTIAKRPTGNIHVIGKMPVSSMVEWVRHAGLYLATARETFGIGTLEALSCGVPVVGWDWGGQSEIIRHGETGFLAEPGDYEALREGVNWALANRATLGYNARFDAVSRWTWESRIKQYAEFYKRARRWWDLPTTKTSIIVTCYNLAHYLNDCLESVLRQSVGDWECLIVDDYSSDETPRIAKSWAIKDKRFRYLRADKNLGLCGARNYGVANSKGRYIIMLDADDMLEENALKTLGQALDSDQSIHIAYGHLDTVDHEGKGRQRNSWPPGQYSWIEQTAHLNQLPYSALIRREVFERTGGYRLRHWRAEDAPFWILATSYGFKAQKVTQAATLIYRMRSDSKSKHEPGDGDWTAWFPFRLGAESGKDGARILRSSGGRHPNPELVPWGAQAEPSEPIKFWQVHDHTRPLVSIIIPVGPGHERLLVDALDSIRGMKFQEWECIVVNATGEQWKSGFLSPVAGAPWARVIDACKKLKPAAARNLGAKHARADLLLFLDADDIILPEAIERMYEIHLGTGGGLVYGDWMRSDGKIDEPLIYYEAEDFKCGDVLKRMRHSVTCLVPKWAHEKINGFDETFPGWEDWDYFIALQSVGVCSYRLEEPIIIYRFRAGTIREESFGLKSEILEIIRSKWADYYEGRAKMACAGCPGKRRTAITRKAAMRQADLKAMKYDQTGNYEELTMLMYQGPGDKVNLRGRITDQYYIFRRNEPRYVRTEDAQIFITWSRKGVPDFVKVEPLQQSQQRERITEVARNEMEVLRPEFPEMPDVPEEPTNAISEIMAKDIALMVLDVGNEILLQWHIDESAGKKRKTVIHALESEMARREVAAP